MNKLLLFSLSLITATVIVGAGQSISTEVNAAAKCDLAIVNGPSNNGIKSNAAATSVSATVKITGGKNCRKPVTLAVWKLPNASGLPLSSQTLFSSSSNTYGPGTHTITSAIPKCSYWQADLLGQLRPKSVNGDANYQYPNDALANYKLGGDVCTPPPPPPPPPVTPTDVCPNIDGMQTEIPQGMIKDANGNCVVTPTVPGDVCPNIDGMQDEVPEGMIKDANGNCVVTPVTIVPASTTPTTLPRTGPVDAAAALGGTGLMASAVSTYIHSRRSLLKSLLFRK